MLKQSNLIDVVKLSLKICQAPIQCYLAYATPYNLVGRVIEGYHPSAINICLLTEKAAHAICQVQNHLNKEHNVGLLVYDAYRPKRAVLDFVNWSKAPVANEFELTRKALHYPHIEKNQLFELGYIAEDSNHCYGNTIDLVLMDLQTKKELDMGAIFDYMDKLSHHSTSAKIIGTEAFNNRQILKNAMTKFGFEPYENEFWHYCHGGRAGSEVSCPLDIPIV